jgi:hypothetical protein
VEPRGCADELEVSLCYGLRSQRNYPSGSLVFRQAKLHLLLQDPTLDQAELVEKLRSSVIFVFGLCFLLGFIFGNIHNLKQLQFPRGWLMVALWLSKKEITVVRARLTLFQSKVVRL